MPRPVHAGRASVQAPASRRPIRGTNIPKSEKTAVSETKAAILRRLISRKSGADLAALQAATGWQPHSIRAALSGLRKAGLTLERTDPKAESGTAVYRITGAPDQAR